MRFLPQVLLAALLGLATSCTPMASLQKNMPMWVGVVPYSHLVNKSWCNSNGTCFPTDCSGFISWALQAPRDLKAYEYCADAYATSISIDDLRYGDIVSHVWDHSPLHRCSKNYEEEDGADDTLQHLGGDDPNDLYFSGHVIFFDKWVDAQNKTEFWAYESTETEDQTPACLAEKGLFTRPLCFNHHVIKETKKTIHKWSKDKCHDSKYGVLTGGPKRISKDLLC